MKYDYIFRWRWCPWLWWCGMTWECWEWSKFPVSKQKSENIKDEWNALTSATWEALGKTNRGAFSFCHHHQRNHPVTSFQPLNHHLGVSFEFPRFSISCPSETLFLFSSVSPGDKYRKVSKNLRAWSMEEKFWAFFFFSFCLLLFYFHYNPITLERMRWVFEGWTLHCIIFRALFLWNFKIEFIFSTRLTAHTSESVEFRSFQVEFGAKLLETRDNNHRRW